MGLRPQLRVTRRRCSGWRDIQFKETRGCIIPNDVIKEGMYLNADDKEQQWSQTADKAVSSIHSTSCYIALIVCPPILPS